MVAEFRNGKPHDPGQYQQYDQDNDREDLPREPAILPAQDEQVGGEDPDVEQQDHGGREQHQVEDVGRRSNDGRQNDDPKDRVPAVPDEEGGAQDPKQREKEDQDRQL